MGRDGLIELTGVGFHNQGAHLMLLAVLDEVGTWGNEWKLGIAVDLRSFRQGRRLGLARIARKSWGQPTLKQRFLLSILRSFSESVLKEFHVTTDRAVTAVLDASGFAISDQWGPQAVEHRAAEYRKRRDQGHPIVLLPQAFGPFNDPRIRAGAAEVFELADLIYARDSESFAYSSELVPDEKLRMAPDFTGLVKAADLAEHESLEGAIVMIPNQRMVDTNNVASGQLYVEFLRNVVRSASDLGRDLVVVIHDNDDVEIAKRIQTEFPKRIRVIRETDPRRVKALLQSPALVVSSRFHGLVSALSQGTPAVGTGWSHKYAFLFRDYGCEGALWHTDMSSSRLRHHMEELLDPTVSAELSRNLLRRGQTQAAEARRMWSEVRSLLGVQPSSGAASS